MQEGNQSFAGPCLSYVFPSLRSVQSRAQHLNLAVLACFVSKQKMPTKQAFCYWGRLFRIWMGKSQTSVGQASEPDEIPKSWGQKRLGAWWLPSLNTVFFYPWLAWLDNSGMRCTQRKCTKWVPCCTWLVPIYQSSSVLILGRRASEVDCWGHSSGASGHREKSQ